MRNVKVLVWATCVMGILGTFSTSVFAIGHNPPEVETTPAELSGTTGCIAGGNVTYIVGSLLLARGVCWNTTGNPTINDPNTSDGTSTGVFTSTVTGLAENTLYYFRAYAENDYGTSYGTQYTIITGSSAVVSGYTLEARTDLPTSNWREVACSMDGTKIIAAKASGSIYTSSNSGATWTERTGAGALTWYGLACSADGTKLVIASQPGSLFNSTDFGATWTERTDLGSKSWTAAAMSSDGTKQVATPYIGSIYTSTNSGVSWTARDASRFWYDVASSSDGVRLIACNYYGHLYRSTDSGATWTEITNPDLQNWVTVASSSDGKKLVACRKNGQIYTSTDFGVTWTARDSDRDWYCVASSADGTHLVASVEGGQLYRSNDSGVTWTAFESNRTWQGIALSSDGSKLMACDLNGYLYTMSSTTAPTVTDPSSNVTSSTTATLGGNVSAINGANVTERGIYWSTTDGFTPPEQGTKVFETGDWNSTGAFTVNVTGLPVGTTIYYKAFAKNSAGPGWSNQGTFSTPKNNQTITFNALPEKSVGDSAFELTASATSGLAVSYTSSNTSVATVTGSTVTIVGAGTTTITASQAGDGTYNAATDVQQVLTVRAAPTPTPTPTPTPISAVTDSTGQASVQNDTFQATVGGFDPNVPVNLTQSGETQTLQVGQTGNVVLSTTVTGAAAGTTMNVQLDSSSQQRTVQITQPSGRKINIILVQFPEGSNVGLNLTDAQQIVGAITNAAGQALDVEIQTQDSGGDITFTITYHPPAGSSSAKTIWLAPGGSMTIEASGVPADGVYKLAVSYANVPLGQTQACDLRLMKVNADGKLAAAGTNDRGNQSASTTLGDYGIDTTAKKVWANVDTLGTFAVGVPKTPVEVVTTTFAPLGCGPLAMMCIGLIMFGFMGLNGKK